MDQFHCQHTKRSTLLINQLLWTRKQENNSNWTPTKDC